MKKYMTPFGAIYSEHEGASFDIESIGIAKYGITNSLEPSASIITKEHPDRVEGFSFKPYKDGIRMDCSVSMTKEYMQQQTDRGTSMIMPPANAIRWLSKWVSEREAALA